MIIDADIYRSAKMLMDRYGDDAAAVANQRVDTLRVKGAEEGVTVWKLIFCAVMELSRHEPVEDEHLH